MTPIMQHNIEAAKEIADSLEDFSSDRIAWLVLNSSFKNLPEWSPESILVSEMLKRMCPSLDGATITHNGFVLESGELISYEN